MPCDHQAPLETRRAGLLRTLAQPQGGSFDLLVIGGGATGLGLAVDAASRGLSVALVEAEDFAKGTSSRATKLLHGGVRYLTQGNMALVREALRERAILLRNAPHLAAPLAFLLPTRRWWERPFYGTGLQLYDRLAGTARLGRTQWLPQDELTDMAANLQAKDLRGALLYWDAQFDDARYALALARTAARHGAVLLNYTKVQAVLHNGTGQVDGVRVRDHESRTTLDVRARCVVNATGVWVDQLRALDAQAGGQAAAPMVTPSQGAHLVVDREFWPQTHALLMPRTSDGRVLFAVPWLGKVILGTTDQSRTDLPLEPRPFSGEIDFILREARRWLSHAPGDAHIRSAWAGLRPLVRPASGDTPGTSRLDRGHAIRLSASGMVNVTGGKWTTYRVMADDILRRCQSAGLLPAGLPDCRTATLRLAGAPQDGEATAAHALTQTRGMAAYGTDVRWIDALPGTGTLAHPDGTLTEAMVRFAARHEYARTVEDVLARRSRMLFLDARLAADMTPSVGQWLREETGVDPQQEAFLHLCRQYAGTSGTNA